MTLRLGCIEFINTLPVMHGVESGLIDSDIELIWGPPAKLNAQLIAGDLDASSISSIAYARNADKLVLLPDLSINSESGVKSVLLFSDRPLENLKDNPIVITGKGQTTPLLLRILCQKLHGFQPALTALSDPTTWEREAPQAISQGGYLLIGDDALEGAARLKAKYIYDLGELWKVQTGTPMVFALWAVRRDVVKKYEDAVFRLTEVLQASKEWGLNHPDELIRAAERKTKLSRDTLRDYFQNLRYDLGDSTRRGLETFIRYAAELGEAPAAVKIEEFTPGLASTAGN